MTYGKMITKGSILITTYGYDLAQQGNDLY